KWHGTILPAEGAKRKRRGGQDGPRLRPPPRLAETARGAVPSLSQVPVLRAPERGSPFRLDLRPFLRRRDDFPLQDVRRARDTTTINRGNGQRLGRTRKRLNPRFARKNDRVPNALAPGLHHPPLDVLAGNRGPAQLALVVRPWLRLARRLGVQPRGRRDQGWLGVEFGGQRGGERTAILHQAFHAPMDVAVIGGLLAGEPDL